MKPVVYWLSEEELNALYSANYWNDIEEEKKKELWISDGQYDKCLNYLINNGLIGELKESIEISGINNGNNLRVADIAAGICWTSAEISKLSSVSEIHSIEISKHRIELLAPFTYKMLNGLEEKSFRYIGSFYDIQLEKNNFDYVFMSAAFHHADHPMHLLIECDKLLKKGGKIILLGERPVALNDILKVKIINLIKALLRIKKPSLDFFNLFPPDDILGDHYYRLNHYKWMFHFLGYDLKHYKSTQNDTIIFIAQKV